MGRELTTKIKCGREMATALVLLESGEIVSRKPLARKFPFAGMTKLAARKGWLEFVCDGEIVAIQLDAAAEAWLDRIKNPPSRVQKLRLKPGMSACLLGDVEAGVAEELTKAGATVKKKLAAGTDLVLLFIRRPAELRQLASIRKMLSAGGAIWVLWPKGAGSEVKHEGVAAAGRSAGLSQTISMGFSQTFTGLRFVMPAKVK